MNPTSTLTADTLAAPRQHREPGKRSVIAEIFSLMASLPEMNRRLRMAERLAACSDEELARRGIDRQTIYHHAFSGLLTP